MVKDKNKRSDEKEETEDRTKGQFTHGDLVLSQRRMDEADVGEDLAVVGDLLQ